MNVLLDTNVLSEMVAGKPNQQVVDFVDSLDEDTVFLSVVTVGEIQRGISRLPDGQRKEVLQGWLDGEMMVRFAGRVLPLDAEVMSTWGKLQAELERKGRKMPLMDSLVGALAFQHRLTLVTRNSRDFEAMAIQLFNPWEGASPDS